MKALCGFICGLLLVLSLNIGGQILIPSEDEPLYFFNSDVEAGNIIFTITSNMEKQIIFSDSNGLDIIKISTETGDVIIDSTLTLNEASRKFWECLHIGFKDIFTCPRCGTLYYSP